MLRFDDDSEEKDDARVKAKANGDGGERGDGDGRSGGGGKRAVAQRQMAVVNARQAIMTSVLVTDEVFKLMLFRKSKSVVNKSKTDRPVGAGFMPLDRLPLDKPKNVEVKLHDFAVGCE